MQFLTLAQIKTRMNNECDLADELFVTDDGEVLSYINAAIDNVEAIIHSLYEDYFLSKAFLTLVSGTSAYAAPSDIYANKIRSLVYNDGSRDYEIKRIVRPQELAGQVLNTGADYRYLLTNTAASGIKINLAPTPLEAGALVECWYIRNAKTLAIDSDECDIPEFIEFIFSHIKWQVARKEKSSQDLETAQKEFMFQRELLEKTLTDMVPDDDSSLIIKDTSFYRDFGGDL